MNIAIIFDRAREDTMGIYFERALKSFGFIVDHFWSRNFRTIPKGYDLYFRVDDSNYNLSLPDALRPRVLYVSDIHLQHVFKKVACQGKTYDLVFCTMRKEMALLAKRGLLVSWLNVGCDPEIHARLDLPRIYDIGFVGSDGGSPRKFILQALSERYPQSYIGHAHHLEMAKIYSQSKIGFSYAIRDECFTMRNYEIMSSGAMLLLHQLRDDSAQRLGYVHQKHLVIFESIRELFEMATHYLEHDNERETIAQAGFELTRKHHTYQHSMREFLQVVKEKLYLDFGSSRF